MKRYVFILLMFFAVGSLTSFAQKKKGDEKPPLFQETNARMLDPEVRVFVTPQICTMKMMSKKRVDFTPVHYSIESFDKLTNEHLASFKARALFEATKEAGLMFGASGDRADAIIEPMYNITVKQNDTKTVWVEVSGYPVQYENFKPITKDDIHLIEVIYPRRSNSEVIRTMSTTQEK